MRRSLTSRRARLSASTSSAPAALPAGSRVFPLGIEVAPDHGRRRSDATLIEASVTARLLGMSILTLDATVALVPAEVKVATPPVQARAEHPRTGSPYARAGSSWGTRGRPAGGGHRLADAVRDLDEGARLLAEVQRDGS
jgi:hypothetical protein